jgi:hypothetical protein
MHLIAPPNMLHIDTKLAGDERDEANLFMRKSTSMMQTKKFIISSPAKNVKHSTVSNLRNEDEDMEESGGTFDNNLI